MFALKRVRFSPLSFPSLDMFFPAGAHDRTRTGDPVLTKNVLYQLSYVGLVQLSTVNYQLSTNLVAGVGFEPT
jgi:hypothetical protein